MNGHARTSSFAASSPRPGLRVDGDARKCSFADRRSTDLEAFVTWLVCEGCIAPRSPTDEPETVTRTRMAARSSV